ncbi:MAG: hypothetical protein M3N08_03845 [Pseudomonadota bacterium]|nr:hypothetical protein [Pseudomonadota bacterium]
MHENLIRGEILSAERLEQFAETLALEHSLTFRGGRGDALRKRLVDNDATLREAYLSISGAARQLIEMPPAAEWLMDNYFVLEEQIREIHNDLPGSYYRKLPKLVYGALKGSPRIYALALAFTAHTDSYFNPLLLEKFLRAYQRQQALDICELWAVSIALRIALVENLRRAAVLVIEDRKARAEADEVAVHLLELVEKDPKALEKGLKIISRAPLSSSFTVQLIRRLRDQDARVIPFLKCLDERLHAQNESAENVVRVEHQSQGALTVTVRNIITSMRLISTFDWVEFFEKVGLVDEALRAQSSFGAMDLPTRNLYRRAIESLAERSGLTEQNVARQALNLTEAAREAARHTNDQRDLRKCDPGYYLIDKGRPVLEAAIGYRPSWSDLIKRGRPTVSFLIYILANIFFVTCVIDIGLAGTVSNRHSFWMLIGLSIAAFFPAWEATITLVNRFVFLVRAPSILPGMALREGIPEEFRTIVVVPVLLGSADEILDQVDQLQVHYLSNPYEDLRFALLSDFKDADEETLSQDATLLEIARERVAMLNRRYPRPDNAPRFYLLHRRRQWNPGQGKWMGWERKRGKLHELNLLLRGARHTSFIMDEGYEQLQLPANVRFVVTLDADTRLPRGSVKRLVGKMSHPLNRGCFDPALGYVVDGYGILQPRVSSSLPEQNSDTLFQRIFYSASGIDPYAFAISDVYQDLFDEGSFTGKGIYDLDVFEQAIADRIPENAVLSHDLIEGIFARAGLASDIEVVEEFPSRYDVASMRQYRWARGDWQLLPWIFGKRSHDVPGLGYWKMVDNLRRSCTAPFTMIALVVGWILPIRTSGLWTAMIIAAFGMPLLLPFIESLIPRRGASRLTHMPRLAADLKQTVQRLLCMIIFLPHHAWLMGSAIVRTLWRLYVSHRNLMEWITAAEAKLSRRRSFFGFYRYMLGSLVLLAAAAAILWAADSQMWALAIPFFVLWLVAPAFAYFSSRPIPTAGFVELDEDDRKAFRLIGRETWRFFENFVVATDNWLPPDNFQEDPLPIVAHRTSPTNIGLYLLAVSAAHDLGWIGVSELINRYENCFATIEKMERYRGHLFNWYDTQELRPLEPRYISSVDSGNFAAYLLVVVQIVEALGARPVISPAWIDGLDDTLTLMQNAIVRTLTSTPSLSLRHLEAQLSAMRAELQKTKLSPFLLATVEEALRSLNVSAVAIVDLSLTLVAEKDGKADQPDMNVRQWARELQGGLQEGIKLLEHFTPWTSFLAQETDFAAALPGELVRLLMGPVPELGRIPDLCSQAAAMLEGTGTTSSAASSEQSKADRLLSMLRQASQNAEDALVRADRLAQQANQLFLEMDFSFLLDQKRKLLAIGFRMADNALDGGCYDLLASEARLASIVAIAKQDIPESNWFRLGRTVTAVENRPALVSWSGSMFEYLMPTLIMREPEDSLIGVTNRMIVRRQISYGEERGIPWGVSESAYNARDLELTYQYSSFGIPGLGLKRGLSDNIVIAPYATALAAMLEPKAALSNYKRMAAIGAHGDYGWYEAIDFTNKRVPAGEKSAVIRAYMAHHQGMSLVAIQNVLLNGEMRNRFHAHPLIQATELLLQELPPRNVAIVQPRFEEVDAIAHIREIKPTQPRQSKSPHASTPRTQLMSNGRYAVMVTAAGSGYSRWRGLALTRWREDPTRDNWGSYIYMRDVTDGRLWSTTYQPTCVEADTYEAVFHEDKTEFVRSDGDLVTSTTIIVSAEDQGEVRRVSIFNRSDDVREIELTSYMELVLAAPATDVAHPAFAKMFIETEFVTKTGTLLATRRPRGPDEQAFWAVHLMSIGGESVGEVQYETDRARFLGRNRSTRDPAALDGRALSGTVGYVLDPIFSLRCRVRLAPGKTTHISFWTLAAASREEALALADKYRTPSAFNRIATLAWTQAQLQYQHLGITPEEAHLFQQLANSIIFADPVLRPNPETLRAGAEAQPVLWSTGVSGDLPIVLMRVDVLSDMKTLRQMVNAHTYWSMKRLEVDLVILNEQPSSYLEDLQNEIELLVRTSQALPRAYDESLKGKIHVLRGDQTTVAARNLLHAIARAVIVGHRGSLAEQLAFLPREDSAPLLSKPRVYSPKSPPSRLKYPPMEFFNGIGGFTSRGREYAIVLEEGQRTPAPWINVIANPGFGFHVSAEGTGYTWAVNSRENKLTPWSNDPVGDECGEAIYLRDIDRGVIWSPVAAPIRKPEATYIAYHGMGYSRFETNVYEIETQLTQYVPLEDPVKISRLKITNKSFLSRRLSVTSFTDWVLGAFRDSSAGLIITEIDPEKGAMFVTNRWAGPLGARTAFVHLSGKDIKVSGDRREFIGRNGSLENPMGLSQRKPVGGKTGAGLDPCSVLQTGFELKPQEQIEIVILLGQAETAESARALIARYREDVLEESFSEIKGYWSDLLEKVQVETPDRSMDIMLNGWLLYQTVVCRVWARSAFYQSSGAYGYRDQLQDVMTVAACRPQWTRQHLLRAAGRQFPEGDVQHWWLPSTSDAGQGVRTRFADDALWLPFVTAYYVKVAGDEAVLSEDVPFLSGPLLEKEQHEAFFLPETSHEAVSLFEHCARAIDKSLAAGSHGIGLFGGGDWNDGMNRVGQKGQGESVWLTWFVITVIRDFVRFAETRDPGRAQIWKEHSERFRAALEQTAWDGEWYRRGYYDDGTPLGSASSGECRIDSIAQSWAVISGAGDPERQRRAMQAVEKYLLRQEEGLALLFEPPFNHTPMDPGYIKGYPPGIRENGGQYTHAALWTAIAFTLMGEGDKAHNLFSLLNPINHANTRATTYRYKVEPYVVAADIYSNPQHVGRGGWTWYTGSAGWMYRAGLESILGLKVEGSHLRLDPRIPSKWPGFKITYAHGASHYVIHVDNKAGTGMGVTRVEMDHAVLEGHLIPLADDGKRHEVYVTLG